MNGNSRNRKSKIKNQKPAAGHTLISSLTAAFIITTVTTFLMQGLATMMKANRATQQRAVASCLLDSELERLRSRPAVSLPIVADRPMTPAGLSTLPKAQMTLTVQQAALPGLKQVAVQVRWREPGGPQRQARLMTLMGGRR